MMAKRIIVFAIALATAAVLQGAVAAPISIHHARPDFILIAVTCLALLTNPAQGVSCGLCGGLAMAAMTGTNYGTFMLSRIAAGWIAGGIGRAMNRDILVTPIVAMAVTTVATQTLAFVIAPYSPKAWAISSVGELVYNLVLVLPVYVLLQRFIRPRKQRDRYERKLYRRR